MSMLVLRLSRHFALPWLVPMVGGSARLIALFLRSLDASSWRFPSTEKVQGPLRNGKKKKRVQQYGRFVVPLPSSPSLKRKREKAARGDSLPQSERNADRQEKVVLNGLRRYGDPASLHHAYEDDKGRSS